MGNIILNIDKPVQVFTINGVDYNLNYDDESIQKYGEILQVSAKEYEESKKRDLTKLSEAEMNENMGNSLKNLLILFLEKVLMSVFMNLLDVLY
ncbi:hypothetical protein [Priestia endophytica]|uniref:hypothetical protein n=1 Tax=Priestia endophytica TaxID=135735 RepID=UPI00227E8C97|nr:hypothetical protein [Priestia endophytica]MCY8234825.1 hypothetical protein [Priestia endophytica]